MKIIDNTTKSRAIGCILGQLAGDALGSLVEFQTPQEISRKYPNGVREIHDGGTWNTIAGQPTDDSEMALALARSIVAEGTYVQDSARQAYEAWLASKPFDIGTTVYNGIRYEPDHQSQANGALMRVSPLGIFGSRFPSEQVGLWAEQDAIITHPNLVCRHINNLFARALSYAIARGPTPREVYEAIRKWSDELGADPSIRDAIADAETGPPKDFLNQQGWILIAFQNAIFQLLHSDSLENGVVNTVSCGGDTDTNAAIAGALLGAIHGESAIPSQWREAIVSCRPDEGNPKVVHPRAKLYWPVDCIELAGELLRWAG